MVNVGKCGRVQGTL